MDMTPAYLAEQVDVITRSTPYARAITDPLRYVNVKDFCRGFDKVLDVGCSGYAPIFFGATHALDVHELAGHLLRANGYAGEFVVGSCDALPFPDKSFPCVVCSEVIEHLPDLAAVEKTFQELDRVGTSWLLTTPCKSIPEKTHRHLFLEPQVKLWAEKYGACYHAVGLWWFIFKRSDGWVPTHNPELLKW